MIIAVLGALCSGKEELALFLQRQFNFKIVNFYKHLAEELDVPLNHLVVEQFFNRNEMMRV